MRRLTSVEDLGFVHQNDLFLLQFLSRLCGDLCQVSGALDNSEDGDEGVLLAIGEVGDADEVVAAGSWD